MAWRETPPSLAARIMHKNCSLKQKQKRHLKTCGRNIQEDSEGNTRHTITGQRRAEVSESRLFPAISPFFFLPEGLRPLNPRGGATTSEPLRLFPPSCPPNEVGQMAIKEQAPHSNFQHYILKLLITNAVAAAAAAAVASLIIVPLKIEPHFLGGKINFPH